MSSTKSELTGAERDAEIDRLSGKFPEVNEAARIRYDDLRMLVRGRVQRLTGDAPRRPSRRSR